MTPAAKKPANKAICPNSGEALVRTTLGPDTPPWLCATCSRSWWQTEVDASRFWRPAERDFGSATADVLAGCAAELAAQLGAKK